MYSTILNEKQYKIVHPLTFDLNSDLISQSRDGIRSYGNQDIFALMLEAL